MTNYDQYWIGEASKLIRQIGLPVPTPSIPTSVSLRSAYYQRVYNIGNSFEVTFKEACII